MKKITALITACLLCSFSSFAFAEEIEQDGMNWEIRATPKPTEEESEAMRWSIVLENDMGVYAYDTDSLRLEKNDDGSYNNDLITVLVKTVFTDKELLRKMDKSYRTKLAKREKTQSCEMLMFFNVADNTYAVKKMDVFGGKGSILETKIGDGTFTPVPEGSFAEAMLKICLRTLKNAESDSQNK